MQTLNIMEFLVNSASADNAAVPVPAGSQPTTVATTGAAPTAAAPTPGLFGSLGSMLPLLLMFVFFYFLLIRPQKKKMKEHQDMLGKLASGDEVVLSSGILGKVSGMSEKVVTLEVAKDVKVKVLKSQVQQVVKGQIQDLA